MSSINGMIDDYNNFRDKVISSAAGLRSASNKAECCTLVKQVQTYSDLQLQTGKRISFCQGDDDVQREYRTRIYPERKRKMVLLQKKCCVPFAQFQAFP